MSDGGETSSTAGRGHFWRGVLVGAVVVVLVIALIAAIGFLAMGRCPMCGRMM